MSGVVEALLTELGSAVSIEIDDLHAVTLDRSGWRAEGSPLAVVTPRSVEQVQAVLRIATAHGVPVVPRGAGSGLAGGANGTDGSIVLLTTGLDRVLEVSAADQLAVVQVGVFNSVLNAQLAPLGLHFAPDPASAAISTIGGNIATNAGGLRCVKYGVTREAVLGLTVVLADGTLMTTGHRSVKGVTGYDLTALLVGSEGTLAVIVDATVRLTPLAEGVKPLVGAWFASTSEAARASAAVTASHVVPSMMEILDRACLVALDEAHGTALAGDAGAYLLVQTDGPGAGAQAERVLEIVSEAGGRASIGLDDEASERLLAVRRGVLPALERHGTVLIEDVAVPRSRMAEMFTEITRIEQQYGVPIPTLAHAGDGNLHPNFIIDPTLDAVPDHVWAAADDLFTTALSLGGTLTGEHGVGVLKRRWLGREVGDTSLRLQQGIKAVFDPAGILDPGKLL